MTVHGFDDFRLDAQARSLHRGGVAVALEPQVFALLLHLVEQRHRVVTKQELLDVVWRGADVADGALHRAVVKLRAALGEGARALPWVRTVHRVGYQFVGRVDGPSPPGAPPAPAAAAPVLPLDGPPRMVVLPLRDRTGDPAQDWAAWGLPRLVFEALEHERGLAMVDMDQVRQALAGLPADLATPAHVGGLLGARWVVEGTLVDAGADGCTLRFVVHGGAPGRTGVTAAGSAALAAPFAQALRRAAGLPAGVPMTTASRDPLALQALARAQELGAHADWEGAARMLKVVLALEPDNAGARLRILPYLEEGAASAEGERLLAEARLAGDVPLEAATHEALGRAAFHRRGADWAPVSERHLSEALALAGPWAHEDWRTRLHLNLGFVRQLRRDHAAALAQFEAAQRRMGGGGNAIFRVAALNNRAIIETFLEQPAVAADLALQALAECERHRLDQLGFTARATASLAECELGWLDNAARRSVENLQRLLSPAEVSPESAAWALLVAAHVALVRRGDAVLAEATHAVRARLGEGSPRARVLVAATDALRPVLADRAGGEAPACEALLAAMESAEAGGFREHTHHLGGLALELALRARDPRALGRVRVALQALSTLPEDAGLQRALQRARAAEGLWQGERAAARDTLAGSLGDGTVDGGRVQALARIDLAWLAACDGDAGRAAALVRPVRAWLAARPHGGVLGARCLALAGDFAGAAELQLDALRRRWPHAPAGWQRAFECYAHGRLPAGDEPDTLLTLA